MLANAVCQSPNSCLTYSIREQARSHTNRRHKKPRSFDQGLCYRIKVASGFLCASRRSVGLEADMAQRTGLEPATPGVTGRYSNRLNYRCVSLDQLSKKPSTVFEHLIDQPWLFNLKPD